MIVYLAWGSLVWEPGDLPLTHDWRDDGPGVRVEFVRQSSNRRLTLVLTPEADPLPSLWARFSGEDLAAAREHLGLREKIPRKNREIHIGSWIPGTSEPECILGLEAWAREHGVTAVVWTALPPKFFDREAPVASLEEALAYLAGLSGETRALAEEYVRRAPVQIATAYRKRFQEELGWHHIGN